MENTVKRVLLRAIAEELTTQEIEEVGGAKQQVCEPTYHDTCGAACDVD